MLVAKRQFMRMYRHAGPERARQFARSVYMAHKIPVWEIEAKLA
jgi:hypothetical protein